MQGGGCSNSNTFFREGIKDMTPKMTTRRHELPVLDQGLKLRHFTDA
jgi:hypothetical protein